MLALFFAALFPAIAISVFASRSEAMQSMYGFWTGFARRDNYFDEPDVTLLSGSDILLRA